MFEQSIIVYLTLILAMVVCGIYASYKARAYAFSNGERRVIRSFWSFEIMFPIVLFSVIMGMRYDVGVDYFTYLYNYLYHNYTGKQEFLFFILSDIGWFFNLHSAVYFGIIAFLQATLFFLAFRDERYLFPFLVFFLFTNGNYLFWMNVIRQALAMCIWLYALKYIARKSFYKYALFIGIAFLVHRSSIVLLALYPLLKNGKDYFKRRPIQVALLLLAFYVKYFFDDFILQIEAAVNFYSSILGDGLYESYSLENLLDTIVESEGSGFGYLFKIVMNIVVILYSLKLKKFYNSRKFIIFYSLFFIGLLASYTFPTGAVFLTRPFRYFYIFQPIMYSYFLYYLYHRRKHLENLVLFWGIIISFLGLFILSQYNATDDSHSLFQFFFQYHINGYPQL